MKNQACNLAVVAMIVLGIAFVSSFTAPTLVSADSGRSVAAAVH